MMLPEVLQAISILEPVIEEVVTWIRGNDPEPPAVLKTLPVELRSEVELRLLKARAAQRQAQATAVLQAASKA